MKRFLAAIKVVSSLFGQLDTRGVIVEDWQKVLARALVGFVIAAIGGFVASLAQGDVLVAGILGALAVVVLRLFVLRSSERAAITTCAKTFTPDGVDQNYTQMIFFALTLLRPLFIFILLRHGNWLWLVIAMTLAEAIAIDSEKAKSDTYVWVSACGVALLCSGIACKACYDQQNMFLIAIIASVVAWMLPAMFSRMKVRLDKDCSRFVGECLILLLGVLGQAM